MIEEYFQLDQQPFKISPDPRFYFDSERHRKALSYLKYGLQQAEGFVVITGDAGVGKSTLVEQFLLETENSDILTGTITTGHVEPGEIIDYVLSAFRIETHASNYPAKHDVLEEFLKDQHQSGHHTLLIVDEAQNLSPETLEELRALSGIALEGTPLLQIFLLGQTVFKTMLSREAMEQFRQRVIAACHLKALDQEATAGYIDYRLAVAGWEDQQSLFTDRAHEAVFAYTSGVPRKINKLCARLLLQVALDSGDCVDANIVERVIIDLEEESLGFSPGAASVTASAAPDILEEDPMDIPLEKPLTEAPDSSEFEEIVVEEELQDDNVVSLSSVIHAKETDLSEINEEEIDEDDIFDIFEEKAAVNADASIFQDEISSVPGGTAAVAISMSEEPAQIGHSVAGGVSSVLDKLRKSKTSTDSRSEDEKLTNDAASVEDLLIPSIDDVVEEEPDTYPESASLEDVADQIAAHVDGALVETPEIELPIITDIGEGNTPELSGLKSDLAGFIEEVREGLVTVENSMTVVRDRVTEVEMTKAERNTLISRRLFEIDNLLKEMRGGK